MALLNTILWIVGVLSSIIVDIPLTAALIPIIEETAIILNREVSFLWWALIFGIGLGANYTPFGSLAKHHHIHPR